MTESTTAGAAPVSDVAPAAPAQTTAQAAPGQEAPAAAGPAPAPASDSVPASATPAAPDAPPAVSVAPQETAPAQPEPAKTSLLTDADAPKAEARPEEKLAEPEKPVELPPIAYEAFTLPEGVSLQGERFDALKSALSESRVDQAHAQKFVDMHVAEVLRERSQWREQQSKAWIDANAAWIEQVKADPEIGGNRLETSLTAAKTLLGQLMHTPEEKAELQQALTMTGAGNHPIIIKAFARAAAMMKEGAPPATAQPKPQLSPAQRRYTSNTGS